MAARKNTFDDKLARIRALARAEPKAAAAPDLGGFLADPNPFLVGEVAKVVADLELRALVPDLVAAFERLLGMPAMADRGCHAKQKVLEALVTLEADAWDTYRKGLRYVQIEVTVGPPVDTAGLVRGISAHALVRTNFPRAALEVTPLLFDETPEARVAAAEALRDTCEVVCAAVLHARVIVGDPEPDVLGACYRGMLALEPRQYLPVVAAALEAGVETAALALGESRLPEALSVLQEAVSRADPELEKTVLLGVALLRTDEALSYLLELVAEAPESRAIHAIQALSLHRHDTRLTSKVGEIVSARKSRKLARAFAERFGPSEG
ncbi:HEAT repeat domain-containing protein [Polyangium sp. 15x6]|uniref:HEAT repeat domain-containing protein n=1 Tax=Polyangium sp. 15x6 TaxID=3042687 RepID=UPI00249A0661|nr:HEAT repeat domain-containing protein [Polyangium sp. 15x6]MDI3289158.1 HEAT repeat domain-containing protein [Polyangium sp. 15x6]